ncbi:Short-chain dehydrogenase [Cyclonatronum proteinivorum]|uniref:Short-chain dehydrogenase n=1 Tax=Cyclonatronum proteinivorum TaxID=1457365 RepID=A0A345UIM7_9BACT|nr:SDR family oxidoreductase [Cyclonatronum proteinivorum]AXJ00329.1 Short-chain dehydrogenase [Cyclonatronum proteinivorum]
MKTILVTGASRGIGLETANWLLSKGFRVIGLARSAKPLDALRKAWPDAAETLTGDLCDDTTYARLDALLAEKDLTLDGIVHNAGALLNKPFTETSDADWQYLLDANLMSAVRLVRSCKSRLNSGAHVLFIGSMGGYQGSSKFPGLAAYSVSKGALSILTECLAAEMAGDQISVNCLCLGAVQTEMLEAAFPGLKAPVEAHQMGAYIGKFASEAHRFFNGKILPVSLADPT